MASPWIQVLTAAGSRGEAERIAAALVDASLAGCVQIVGPVHSVFRWEGAMQHADEWLCLCKTRRDRYEAVEAAIHDLHSYECPEVIAMPIEAGSAAYLAYLAGELDKR